MGLLHLIKFSMSIVFGGVILIISQQVAQV